MCKFIYKNGNYIIMEKCENMDECVKNINKKRHKKKLEEQFAIVISASCAFIIAYTINTLLNHMNRNYIYNSIIQHFIYVIGIIIIFTLVAYYIDSLIDNSSI